MGTDRRIGGSGDSVSDKEASVVPLNDSSTALTSAQTLFVEMPPLCVCVCMHIHIHKGDSVYRGFYVCRGLCVQGTVCICDSMYRGLYV